MTMPDKLDCRKIIVELDLETTRKRYEGSAIKYSVTKTGNGQMNEATIGICNMLKEDRDYILKAATPLRRHRQRKKITLFVGTRDTGTARLFTGDITEATVTQPPDIWLMLKAKTGYFARSSLVSVAAPEREKLSAITDRVAGSMGLQPVFQADDKMIENYSFTGGAGLQVDKLGEAALVNAYIEDDRLIVRPAGEPLKGKVRKLDKHSGMIGIPELNEQGVKVKMLHDLETTVGFQIDIESELNPAASGSYVIHKATYTGESHGQPFYIDAEARPKGRRGWIL